MRFVSFFLLCIAALGQAKLTGGNGKMFIGGRPGVVLIFDEATEKVTGQFKTRCGTPALGGMLLSKDRKLAFWDAENHEDIEVADLNAGQVIDNFRLSEGNKKVRLRSMEPDPTNSRLVLTARAYTKMSDHWEIGPNEILLYDLKEHKVARKIPWPKGEEKEFANFKYSPDGKFLYVFGEEISVLDTTQDYKEVDHWDLTKPYEDGLGRVNFGGLDDTYEDPGFFTGVFTIQDSVQNRRIMGIGRVNLAAKNVDFNALGPATGLAFAMSPDRGRAYGLHSEIGKYEFWTFDMKSHAIHSRSEFPGRPRMSLKTSSNGKLLYIFMAGHTIDVYEAATYKYLRTIEFDTDMSGLLLVPGK